MSRSKKTMIIPCRECQKDFVIDKAHYEGRKAWGQSSFYCSQTCQIACKRRESPWSIH